MATLSAQIQDLVGSFSDETAMDQWLEDGAKEIISVLPSNLQKLCTSMQTFTSVAAGSEAETLNTGKIFSVYAGSVDCRKIDSTVKYRAEDSGRIDYATSTDPVYYVESNFINVLPASLSCKYEEVQYPSSIDADSDSAIASFPDEAEYLAVLYASIKALQQQMNTKQGDLPANVVAPVLETISESLPTWSAPSDFVSPVKPAVPTISSQSVSDPSSFAPTYTKPSLALSIAPTISDLSITAVPPDTPSLTSITFSSIDSDVDASLPTFTTATVSAGGVYGASTVPAYTKAGHPPQVAFSAYTSGLSETDPGILAIAVDIPSVPTITAASVTITGAAPIYVKPIFSAPTLGTVGNLVLPVAPVAPSISSQVIADPSSYAPTYTKPALALKVAPTISDLSITAVPPDNVSDSITDFAVDGEYTDAIAKAKALIDTATIGGDTEPESVQYWLNNEDPEMSSATLQAAAQEIGRANLALNKSLNTFNADVQKYQASGLNTFSAEISEYQAEVNTQVQEYQQNLSGDLQVWQTERQTDLQKYGNDIQNELNEYNKENAKYQAILQEYIQEAQLLDAHEARKLQKYQAEVSTYGAEVNAKIQEWVNEEWNQNFQKYQTDYSNKLQEHSTNLQNELNQYNEQNTEYQAILQKNIQDAQLEDSEESKKIQKYQAEISSYQAQVSSKVQEYGQRVAQYQLELNTAFQAWSKTESDNLQVFQSDMQNELNDFNKDNASFQANIQEAMQEIQVANQVNLAKAQGELQLNLDNENRSQQRQLQNAINDMKVIFDSNSQTIQKYQIEISLYQAEVNTEIQEYQQNLAGDIQVWQTERSTDLQKYGSDMQNELNEFNKENVKYQAILQEYIQEAQLLDAHEARKLQKYQAEVSTYGSEVNTNVQVFTQALTKNRVAFDTSLQKYTSEVQKVASANQSKIQVYTGEVSSFTQIIQRNSVDYQWLQSQYAQLKADYQQGLQLLRGGGAPQPAQQQQGR